MSDTVEKRKLSELRVVDLKQELEKRGKDGNGVKNVLLERLTQVSGWQTFCSKIAILDFDSEPPGLVARLFLVMWSLFSN